MTDLATMYLKLTQDIVDAAIAGNKNAQHIMRQLDACIMLGTHFVFVDDITTLDKITAHCASEYAYLRKIREDFSNIGAIAAMLDWHVEFDLIHPHSYVDEVQKTIFLSYTDAQQKAFCEETHVIAENLCDIEFFKTILEIYKGATKKRIHHRFYPILGGGATTARVLESEIKNRKSFVVCVVDSDKHFPGDSTGNTAKMVKSYMDKQSCPCAQYYIMENVTEVENLVPMKVYEQYVTEAKDRDLIDRFKTIQRINVTDETLLDYFDFKEGITHHLLQNVSNRTYAERTINILDANASTSIRENDDKLHELKTKLDASGLLTETNVNKLCIEAARNIKYVNGMGAKVLDNVLQDKHYLLYDVHYSDLSSAQIKEYNAIGSFLLNWTCSGRAMRS